MRTVKGAILLWLVSLVACRLVRKRQALDPDLFPSFYWDNATLTVSYDESILSDDKILMSAVDAQVDLTYKTCVQFVEAEDMPEYQQLYFTVGRERCQSVIGRRGVDGQQPVYIAPQYSSKGDIEHELMHALGFAHTQNRNDAAKYVTVDASNVNAFNLNRLQPWNNLTSYNFPYEYGSLMHYDAYRYSRNENLPVTAAKETNHQQTMGSVTGYSFYDIKFINEHFKCLSMCDGDADRATCTNGGYPNPNACYQCVCPRTYYNDCSEKHPDTTELKADNEYQTLDIGYPGKAAVQDDWTFNDYWITTDPALLIQIVIEKQQSPANHHFEKCLPGCSQGGIEIRASNDKAATGYRFCCNSQLPVSVNATGPILPVIFFNRYGGQNYSIKYRQVSDPKKCSVKYDLFYGTESGANPVLVQSLRKACNSSIYMARATERVYCDLLAYQLQDILRRDLAVDEKLRAVKTLFDGFTDSQLTENRVNFTKVAIIDGWGTFSVLLHCLVDSPPTTPGTKAETTTTGSAKRTTAKTTVPVTTKQPTAPAATTKDPNDEFARCIAYITAWPEFVEDLRSGCFVRWNQSDTNWIHCVFFVFQLRSVQTSNQSVDAKLAGLQTVVSAYDRGIAKRREFLVSITSQRPEWSWIYARCMG